MTDNFETLVAQMPRRRAFHQFSNTTPLTESELDTIKSFIASIKPLNPEIKTEVRIVPIDAVNCNRKAEYAILLFTEEKENYLQNIGYIGQHIDLFLPSMGIGTLWFGMGKPKTAENLSNGDLKYQMMIVIAKVQDTEFRTDFTGAGEKKHKALNDIWVGDDLPIEINGITRNMGEILRYVPSAVNMQPFQVHYSAAEGVVKVYRHRGGLLNAIPPSLINWYGRHDAGIMICYVELMLRHAGYNVEMTCYNEQEEKAKLALQAEFKITK